MFNAINITEGTLTVITFCQKTKNDMTSWSPSVEEERDALTDKVCNGWKLEDVSVFHFF
jgi:hypothetical protein